MTVMLFVYGSLRDPAVQRALFGRLIEGRPDALPGYRLSTVTIRDAAAIATSGTATHRIVRPGDPGTASRGWRWPSPGPSSSPPMPMRPAITRALR